MAEELDLSAYEAAVVEHVLIGAARRRMFDDVAANRPWTADLVLGTLTIGERTYPAQVLGTIAKEARTFLWAWANPAATQWKACIAAATELHARGEIKGNAVFAERSVAEGWVDARELAVVCGELTGGHPVYFADAGTAIAVFLVQDAAIDATKLPLPYLPGVILDAASYTVVDRTCVTQFLVALGMSVDEGAEAITGTRGRDAVTVRWDATGRVADIQVRASGRES